MRRGTGEKVNSPDGTPFPASEDDPTGKRKHERRVLRAFASPQQTRCTFLFVVVTLICTYLIILGSERFGAQVTSKEGVLAQSLVQQADGDGSGGKVASAGITGGLGRKGHVSRGLATSRRWLDIFKTSKNPRLDTPYGNLRVFIYDNLKLPESDQKIRLVDERLDQRAQTGGLIAELIRKSNVYTGYAQLADYYLVPVPDPSIEEHIEGQDPFTPFAAFIEDLSTKFPFWNRTGGRDHIFLISESSRARLQDDDLLRIRKSIFLLPPVPRSESRFDTWKDIVVPPSNGASSDKSMARQRSIFEVAPTRPHLLFFETTANGTDGSPLIQRLSETPHLPDTLLPSDPLTCHGSCALQRVFESKFCLCNGREFNRLFFGAIGEGCIPVLLGDAPELPFEAFLDYADFTVKVEADISREGLIDILSTVAKHAIDRKQAALSAAAHSFRYDSDSWIEKGAFDLVLRELGRRKRFFRNSSERFWTKALPLG
ncbi:hypothetical protein KFL_005470020 [Klebsormidium nitens]|uniref:Exostosin GT47 domain-containing protein n=1 Tax=Klebsormidium nitens TaxID=105231 RepID=A0A1Y1IFK2_KLENI|nr:hypothetical protein KFL_005470020 [Klebsormidium nitens]|eukprot:GAQ89650.1 hypothetical protein KFL_005470020 [Klebsormidium nitens]